MLPLKKGGYPHSLGSDSTENASSAILASAEPFLVFGSRPSNVEGSRFSRGDFDECLCDRESLHYIWVVYRAMENWG